MGANRADFAFEHLYRRTNLLFDDFNSYTDTQLWTKGHTGTGTSVANSGINGNLVLTTGATQNNEVWVTTTNAFWKFQNNKPIIFEIALSYTEASTNKAGIAIGFGDVLGTAAFLADTTLQPVGTASAAVIYKTINETVWRAMTSLSTTQTLSNKSTTSSGGGTQQVLRVEVVPVTSTIAEASFFVGAGAPGGGQLTALIDSTVARPTVIKQSFTYTSAAAMVAGIFVKAGAAASEVVTVDYMAVEQLR